MLQLQWLELIISLNMEKKANRELTLTMSLLKKDRYIWINANSTGKPNRPRIIMKREPSSPVKRLRKKKKTRKMGKRTNLFQKIKTCSKKNC